MGPGRPAIAGGGVIGPPEDEGIVDDENESAGVSGAGGEWKIVWYAKRTCFSLAVEWRDIGSIGKKGGL